MRKLAHLLFSIVLTLSSCDCKSSSSQKQLQPQQNVTQQQTSRLEAKVEQETILPTHKLEINGNILKYIEKQNGEEKVYDFELPTEKYEKIASTPITPIPQLLIEYRDNRAQKVIKVNFRFWSDSSTSHDETIQYVQSSKGGFIKTPLDCSSIKITTTRK